MRRHIQDLPLKTSHISDYNVGVSALADASFFSIMESSSYDRNVMLRGNAMRRKKGCHRNSSAGKRLLMQLWEALPVQG